MSSPDHLSSNISKAETYLIKAKKAIAPTFFIWGGKRWDEAAEYTKTAANYYKVEKNYELAASTYLSAINYYHNIADDRLYEISECYVQVLHCYYKSNIFNPARIRDIECVCEKVVSIKLDLGINYYASKVNQELGDFYNDHEMYTQAISKYETAIEYYLSTSYTMSIIVLYGQICDILVEKLEKYDAAVTYYTKLIDISSKIDRSYQYIMCKHITKLILCVLASGDIVYAGRLFNKHSETNFMFSSSTEGIFTSRILKSVKNYDINLFNDTIHSHKFLIRTLNLKLLDKIKSHIESVNCVDNISDDNYLL